MSRSIEFTRILASCLFCSLCLGVVADSGRAEGKASGATFKGSVDLVDVPQLASNFSQDGKACSLLCRNLHVDVSSQSSAPASSRMVTVNLPISNPDKSAAKIHIRGYAHSQENGQRALIVMIDGKTIKIDLDAACKNAAKAPKVKSQNSSNEKYPESKDFFHELHLAASNRKSVQLTFVLLAERQAELTNQASYLSVDSVDIVLQD